MKTELGGGEMAHLTADEGAKASLDMICQPGQELNGQSPKVLSSRAGRSPRDCISMMDQTLPGNNRLAVSRGRDGWKILWIETESCEKKITRMHTEARNIWHFRP